ncbi:GNAT family N-acetyltransferase [Candidatus Thorarchaeota archaeon]|jgi:GNAT superfamily N-acetyltransferase|nr:MAG: GNAT family N-acetyltransferase [Candidatus Thorarchaeota archaeon]
MHVDELAAFQVVHPIYNYAEVRIRRANMNEVDIVRDIIQEAYKPILKQLSRPPAALQEGMDKIARHIQMGNIYLALVGDAVAGTMRVELRGKLGVISRVAVLERFRGRRIGTALMDYAENLLSRSNAKSIELEVYGAIDQQIDFYKKLGYEEKSRHERAGEEIVVMEKDFEEEDVIVEDDY